MRRIPTTAVCARPEGVRFPVVLGSRQRGVQGRKLPAQFLLLGTCAIEVAATDVLTVSEIQPANDCVRRGRSEVQQSIARHHARYREGRVAPRAGHPLGSLLFGHEYGLGYVPREGALHQVVIRLRDLSQQLSSALFVVASDRRLEALRKTSRVPDRGGRLSCGRTSFTHTASKRTSHDTAVLLHPPVGRRRRPQRRRHRRGRPLQVHRRRREGVCLKQPGRWQRRRVTPRHRLGAGT
mmetsp:Transcript_36420/g.100301  ORF Transcript_36420/g.100301 Transcript_36420/m.100301 type:complete len:238 (+) Transcript_36420:587-1300(+)